jgi:heme exporter protein A
MLEGFELSCIRGDKRLFSQVSFRLDRGGLLFVHGPNGSGKTTLLRALCGLGVPASGDVRWEGQSIRKLGESYREHVSYLGHLNGLKDELTGLENLRFATGLAGRLAEEHEISDTLARLGVEVCQDLPTKLLSQGQKKRVALARFLLLRTRLWILDEAFTALDVHAVDVLQAVISEHVDQGGMAILTTHQSVSIPARTIHHLHLNS